MLLGRRRFLSRTAALGVAGMAAAGRADGRVQLAAPREREDLFAFLARTRGRAMPAGIAGVLGAANPFKEGDEIVGVAAADERSRARARQLLANTRVSSIDANPVFEDELFRLIRRDQAKRSPETEQLTIGQLRERLLEKSEAEIRRLMAGLSSDVIACVVKLMSNRELIAVARKVFNPLPSSRIGARGYLGARIQPNSPTDNLDDIRWQVFNGWAFAVGDVLLGTNPVSSEPRSVAAIELALADLLDTFGIGHLLPHCVLSHIDVQAEVERLHPGSTALWFQSIAGCDSANETFDVDVHEMLRHADARSGRFGLYFETGQGADFTNGHGHGFDMVLHESRKYGFARVLKQRVAESQGKAGRAVAPWVHLNDVAGFIGPEVFRTREQLVRCCLEDIVMGKLHGLTIGLDVCSTLHMEVSLDDLDWCLDRIAPANPAYLMGLPTKNDPMLGYLTTGFQDHVRLRERFGYKVDDRIWAFFQSLGVIDTNGRPTEHFGDPLWVYLQYRRRKGDRRPDEAITAEGEAQLSAVRSRGVFIARGHGERIWDLEPSLDREVRRIYRDAKQGIWATLDPEFVARIPNVVRLSTRSKDRRSYILHPTTGETLSDESRRAVEDLKRKQRGRYDVQIVVSDGLNALAIMEERQLAVFLSELRSQLAEDFKVAPETLVVTSGRVRAGYRIGESLFGSLKGRRAIVHLIGERPGTGHHTFSAYLTAAPSETWTEPGRIDHNVTQVVAGIANTALAPEKAAADTARLLSPA